MDSIVPLLSVGSSPHVFCGVLMAVFAISMSGADDVFHGYAHIKHNYLVGVFASQGPFAKRLYVLLPLTFSLSTSTSWATSMTHSNGFIFHTMRYVFMS